MQRMLKNELAWVCCKMGYCKGAEKRIDARDAEEWSTVDSRFYEKNFGPGNKKVAEMTPDLMKILILWNFFSVPSVS